MALTLWHVPLRLATGAYILNSGLSKRGVPDEVAQQLHGFATSAYPQFKSMDPAEFVKRLSTAETSLGAGLLIPLVPSWLAGFGLTTFAAGLNWLYWKAPGLRQEGDIRPTQEGIGIAKDVWMTAIGMALILDALMGRARSD